jgi:hypothetical protein
MTPIVPNLTQRKYISKKKKRRSIFALFLVFLFVVTVIASIVFTINSLP